MRFVARKPLPCLLLLVALPAGYATGQVIDADSGGIRVFEPQYYVEFDPISALELVFRTPGFQPQEQDGGRGLSGVRSNILIDGERPPPKGRSIRQRLREMPIAGVAYIELIDAGARLDIDMQGYPQVVNVVTVEDPPAYYEIETQFMEAGTGDPAQQNASEREVQATGTFYWSGHEFTLRGDTRDRTNESPSGFVSIDPANPVQRLSSINRQERTNDGIQINAELDLPNDSGLSITAQFGSFNNERYPISLEAPDDELDIVRQNNLNDNEDRELSAEFRRPLASRGEFMFAFVDATEEQTSDSSLTSGATVRSSLNARESGETASRLLVTNIPTDQLTVRTTATTAHNYFEGRFQLFENGVELPVDGSDSRVEEDRHALESTIDWNLSDKWTLQSSAGLESYDIRAGDTASGRQTDPRGNVKVTFRPQPRTTFSLESRRVIGQLSFNQFLASSSLSSEIVSAGASELEPVRRWIHTASYDKRFGDVGVMRVNLTREQRDNPIRTVALSDELTVSQNTSEQIIDSLEASVEFPFEQFDREDLILNVTGYAADSETVDPVTGETRQVSGVTKRYWQLGIRKDPGDGRLAWGMSVYQQRQGDNFSVRTISNRFSKRQWQANVEWEVIEGLRLGAEVDGPRTEIWQSNFFGMVRETGLTPSFQATTISRMDRSASVFLEWRRRDHVEIRLNLSTQPKVIDQESLLDFSDASVTQLEQQIARTPRAWLRIRYFR